MAKPESAVVVIERREIIRRPMVEVFAFFDRPSNLKRVFPANLAVALLREPADLRQGTLFGYRLNRWPVDFEWDAVVSDYKPPARFTEVKAKGYFPRWTMEHDIVSREPGSELTMRLSYEVPTGLYSAFTHRYVIRDAMRELVEGKLQAIRDALEKAV